MRAIKDLFGPLAYELKVTAAILIVDLSFWVRMHPAVTWACLVVQDSIKDSTQDET